MHQATMRTGQQVSSQWVCELLPGTHVKILEVDTNAKVGRQRALVKTQLAYVTGWMSIRTARGNYLVEKVLPCEDFGFDSPDSRQVCGCDARSDPVGVANVAGALAIHIKHQPDFGTLTSADFVISQRFQSLFRFASGSDSATLDSQRLRWSLWGTISPSKSPPEGLAILSVVLLQIRGALMQMHDVFWRLHEEFVCLEDAEAEALFNAPGETQAAAMIAKQLSEKCQCSVDLMTLPSSTWFTHLPNPASMIVDLEKGEHALKELHGEVAKLTSQRRTLVARVKAAVEARAATEAVSAVVLLADALRPDRRLDFPLVTELCERATSDPTELIDTVNALASVLEESEELPRRLKALTVANELMYDDTARQAFARRPGFLETLLQPMSFPSSDASPNIAFDLAAANAQLLTTEIVRRVNAEAGVMKAGCLPLTANPTLAAPTWLMSVAHTPSRQTGQAEHLLSWPRARVSLCSLRTSLRGNATNVQDATGILDQVYRHLDEAAVHVSKLRQSLDHTISPDVGELIEDFLSSAKHVNSSILEWKCRAVDALDVKEASAAASGGNLLSPLSNRGQRKALSNLLDRAESVGESLNACLSVLLARRGDAAS